MSSQSDSILELGKALVKVQSALMPAVRDAKNPFLKTSYASLNSVLDSCRSALRENGLIVIQSPMAAPEHLGANFIGLETKIIHAESGEWLSSVMTIPLAKLDPQAMGAAISYGRRYALAAMLGIVSEEDGDCETRKLEPRRQEARPDSQPGNAPDLSGVTYDYQKGNDGRQYVVATGNTRQHAQALRKAGFTWNNRRSCWYKAA